MSMKWKTGHNAFGGAATSVGGQMTVYTSEDAVKLVGISLLAATSKLTS